MEAYLDMVTLITTGLTMTNKKFDKLFGGPENAKKLTNEMDLGICSKS